MLLLRKIDCYGQLILAGSMMTSCLVLTSTWGLLVGLFFLGCWQVISAILNSYGFVHCGFAKRIYYYWIACLLDLILFFLSYSPAFYTGHLVPDLVFAASMIASLFIAGYYWWIYFRLIGFISLRNELDGLTKSKH